MTGVTNAKVWDGSQWVAGVGYRQPVDVQVFTSSSNTSLSGGWYHDGTGMVGTNNASNTLYHPDLAAHRPTGDLEIIFYGKAEVWSNRTMMLISHGRTNGAGNYNYLLQTNTSGQFVFGRSAGAGARLFTSAAHNIPDDTAKWVKVEFDQDNGSSQSETKFYLSDDGTTWTQLGSAVTNANTGAGNTAAGGLYLGATYSGNTNGETPFRGTMYKWQIKDGIGGTTVFDLDLTGSPANTRRWQVDGNQAYLISTSLWEGVWTKPANAEMVRVLCVGAGGGASGGTKGAAGTARNGGVAGASGTASIAEFQASELASTVAVTVGKGGIGGPKRTGNNLDGFNTGPAVGSGQPSSFGTLLTTRGGSGGTGSGGAGGLFDGTGKIQAATPSSAPPRGLYAAGGGTGGGIPATNIASTGGPGGTPLTSNFAGFVSLGVGGRCGNASITGDAEDGQDGLHGCGGGGGGAAVNDVGNSGAGGNGGDGLVVVVSYAGVDLQAFTTSGTWTKPSGDYKIARVFAVGGGGGGASGPTGTPTTGTSPTFGGGGGGAAGVATVDFDFAQLPATVNVTVGAGGAGGAGVTGNDTPRNGGNAGGASSFLNLLANGGGGAAADSPNAGVLGIGATFAGTSGSSGQTGSGSAGPQAGYTAGGGSGSGSLTTGTGGQGGLPLAHETMPATGVGSNTANAPSGQALTTGEGIFGGSAGAGGGAANSGTGKDGGNGARGSGGGGGGRGANGFTSGAGGNGGDGYVCVICY